MHRSRPRRVARLKLAVLLVSLCVWSAACSDDTEPANQNNDGWKLNNTTADMAVDMTAPDMSAPDMTDPVDMPPDMSSPPDMEIVVDMPPDMSSPPDMEDMAPDMAPQTLDAAVLTKGPWLSINILPAENNPAVIGIAYQLRFDMDGTVKIDLNRTLTGKWQVLANGRLYVYELTGGDPNGMTPSELMFDPIRRDGGIAALTIYDPNGNPQPVFELMTPDRPVEVQPAELEGRWRSIMTFPGQMPGQMYRLGMRMDAQGTFEYGAVQNGNFSAFLTEKGSTATMADGRTYWHFIPPTQNPMVPPLAGQLLRAVDGSVRLFAPLHDDMNDVFYVIEMEKVDAF